VAVTSSSLRDERNRLTKSTRSTCLMKSSTR
jgi:hypothetical protein